MGCFVKIKAGLSECTNKLSEALEKLNKNRDAQRSIKKKVDPAPNSQLALELWPERVRGVPNVALRGALFGVSKVRTTAKKRTLIAALSGIEIRFKGERFNQHDLDTWEMLLHLGRDQQLGDRVSYLFSKKRLKRPITKSF